MNDAPVGCEKTKPTELVPTAANRRLTGRVIGSLASAIAGALPDSGICWDALVARDEGTGAGTRGIDCSAWGRRVLAGMFHSFSCGAGVLLNKSRVKLYTRCTSQRTCV